MALHYLAPGPRSASNAAATYRNTPLSAVLRDRNPGSMRSLVRSTVQECYAPYQQFVAGALCSLLGF